MNPARIRFGSFELGHFTRPKRGETACGDAVWAGAANGELRLAVVDGLGHGRGAAEVTAKVLSLVPHANWSNLRALMLELDQALRSSRGAALALLKILPDGVVEHCGIGNVALTFSGSRRQGAHPRAGIVGARPRVVAVDRVAIEPGHTLVVHTDGVSERFKMDPLCEESAEVTARRIVNEWGKDHDDAGLALVRRRM